MPGDELVADGALVMKFGEDLRRFSCPAKPCVCQRQSLNRRGVMRLTGHGPLKEWNSRLELPAADQQVAQSPIRAR
jgi:hypothetical protein